MAAKQMVTQKGSYAIDDMQLFLFDKPYLLLFSEFLCAYYFWEINGKGCAKSVFNTHVDGGFCYSVFYISALCQTYITLSLAQ